MELEEMTAEVHRLPKKEQIISFLESGPPPFATNHSLKRIKNSYNEFGDRRVVPRLPVKLLQLSYMKLFYVSLQRLK